MAKYQSCRKKEPLLAQTRIQPSDTFYGSQHCRVTDTCGTLDPAILYETFISNDNSDHISKIKNKTEYDDKPHPAHLGLEVCLPAPVLDTVEVDAIVVVIYYARSRRLAAPKSHDSDALDETRNDGLLQAQMRSSGRQASS